LKFDLLRFHNQNLSVSNTAKPPSEIPCQSVGPLTAIKTEPVKRFLFGHPRIVSDKEATTAPGLASRRSYEHHYEKLSNRSPVRASQPLAGRRTYSTSGRFNVVGCSGAVGMV
jgi:hypothetical protein